LEYLLAIRPFARGVFISYGMAKMRSQHTVRCHVVSEDDFVKHGIMSVLISAGYEIYDSIDCEDGRSCDIALLYTDRQSRASCAALCAALSERCKLVVLAQPRDADTLPPQTFAGAAAVLDRSVSQQKLLVTLDAVLMGVIVRDAPFFRPGPEAREILFPAPAPRPGLPVAPPVAVGIETPCTFSMREQEILLVLAEGVSNKHIARKFDIAESTVKVHVKHILRKLNMHNRTQAAIWAKSYGPIPA
jgi:two-component system, NarL family, nitrate/nitrite response regulator NarL